MVVDTAKGNHMATVTNRGVTLVELMIVIALLGIMFAIAVPFRLHHRTNTDLNTAARGVAGDLFNMKQRAAAERTPYRIEFDEANQHYRLVNGGTNEELQTKNFSTLSGGIIMSNTTFTGKKIEFFVRGTASPGSVTLTNTRNSKAVITVNITGRTHVTYTMQ